MLHHQEVLMSVKSHLSLLQQGNSGHTQTSDNYTYFVLVLNKEQHCNYNSSIVTSYTHMLENEHDTMSICNTLFTHKYAIHTNE